MSRHDEIMRQLDEIEKEIDELEAQEREATDPDARDKIHQRALDLYLELLDIEIDYKLAKE